MPATRKRRTIDRFLRPSYSFIRPPGPPSALSDVISSTISSARGTGSRRCAWCAYRALCNVYPASIPGGVGSAVPFGHATDDAPPIG